MTGISKKIGAVFFMIGAVVLLCLSCLCSAASAEGSVRLTLVCKARNDLVDRMPWSVFRIGSLNGGAIVLEGDFANYPVDMSDLSTAGLADAASTLKEYAFTYKLKPYAKGKTDKNGTVTFEGLEDGVYLIAAKKHKSGDKTFIPTPAIIEVNSAQSAELTVYPKISSIRTLADEFERFNVRKVWEKYEGMLVKPTEIVVDIYRDYEFYETVTLSADNDWNYSWEELVGSEWTMIERKIPEDCTVVYRNDGRRYIVVNTYNPEFIFDWDVEYPPPQATTTVTGQVSGIPDTNTTTAKSFPVGDGDDTTPSSDSTATGTTDFPVGGEDETTVTVSTTATSPEENDKTSDTTKNNGKSSSATTTAENKLPQTGQLWWPVPVMAIVGLVLIAAGTRIIFGCKRENDE